MAKPGVLYTRYVFNDKWFGDFYHATDRSQQRNLLDKGAFYGVMEGNRAIGVYAAQGPVQGRSAKAAFIWTGCGEPEEVWIDGARVTSLPADVPSGATVVVGSGDVFTAIRPLTRTTLGKDTTELVARGGRSGAGTLQLPGAGQTLLGNALARRLFPGVHLRVLF